MKIKLFDEQDSIRPNTYRYREAFLFIPKIINNELRWLMKTSWIEQYSSGLWYQWRVTTWADNVYYNEQQAIEQIEAINRNRS